MTLYYHEPDARRHTAATLSRAGLTPDSPGVHPLRNRPPACNPRIQVVRDTGGVTGDAQSGFAIAFDLMDLPLAKAQANLKADIETRALGLRTGGFAWDFGTADAVSPDGSVAPAGVRVLQTRESDLTLWNAVASSAQAAIAAAQGSDLLGVLRCEDNVRVAVTAGDALTVMLAMKAAINAVLERQWDLKDQVSSAEDLATLHAIAIGADWPDPRLAAPA